MTAENLDVAVKIATSLSHKKRPLTPEQTLQKTIQNLRDKGMIAFLGGGQYKLTEAGFAKMSDIVEKWNEWQDKLAKFKASLGKS